MTWSSDSDDGSPAAVSGSRQAFVVEVEPDATPLCRWVATTLRRSAALPDADVPDGVYALRSTSDAQSVTLRCATQPVARVYVQHGVATDATATGMVDTADDFALSPSGPDAGDLASLQRLLRPPRPAWRECAALFWEQTAALAGMPERLDVHCTDDGGSVSLGSGASCFGISGDGASLALVLTGSLQPDDAIRQRRITVRGTFPQLSVLVGASWKVRMDV